MTKLTTCVWFNGDAEQAAAFYAEHLPGGQVGRVIRSPTDTPSGPKGSVLVVEFTVAGQAFMGLNGGPQFPHSEAVSFQIHTDDQAETDRLWNAITADGGAESACGWCKDKWGVNWQITPRALTQLMADPEVGEAAMQAMMTMRKIDIAALEEAAANARAAA